MVTGIRVYGATDVGRARTSNEDCHAALVGDGCLAGIDALLIVADGLGGHAAGANRSTKQLKAHAGRRNVSCGNASRP